jgi:hypothetical protein
MKLCKKSKNFILLFDKLVIGLKYNEKIIIDKYIVTIIHKHTGSLIIKQELDMSIFFFLNRENTSKKKIGLYMLSIYNPFLI